MPMRVAMNEARPEISSLTWTFQAREDTWDYAKRVDDANKPQRSLAHSHQRRMYVARKPVLDSDCLAGRVIACDST
jgi:hypothetical protein